MKNEHGFRIGEIIERGIVLGLHAYLRLLCFRFGVFRKDREQVRLIEIRSELPRADILFPFGVQIAESSAADPKRDWRNCFDEQYLQSIKFVCLAMSDEYIDLHFEEIKSHGSDIETRLDDSYCTAEQLKQDNHRIIDGYRSTGEQITLITENYYDSIRAVLDERIPA